MNKRIFTACMAVACILPVFKAEAQSDYFFRSPFHRLYHQEE